MYYLLNTKSLTSEIPCTRVRGADLLCRVGIAAIKRREEGEVFAARILVMEDRLL